MSLIDIALDKQGKRCQMHKQIWKKALMNLEITKMNIKNSNLIFNLKL